MKDQEETGINSKEWNSVENLLRLNFKPKSRKTMK